MDKANQQPSIQIHEALGAIAQQYQIAFIDYAIIQNNAIRVYSSDLQNNLIYPLSMQTLSACQLEAHKNKILPWEKYCLPQFQTFCQNEKGFTPNGIDIITKHNQLIEHFAIITCDEKLDIYQIIRNNPELQEQIMTRIKNYIISTKSQYIDIQLKTPSIENNRNVSETLFLKLEPHQKEFSRKQYHSATLENTLLESQDQASLADLSTLFKMSSELNVSIYTAQAYMQLIRRKEANLFEKEISCLYLAAKGLTAKETGQQLNISMHTAREYRQSIIKKLNASNISHALYIALKRNIIS